MKVELPGESKSFADIEAGECFAFTRKQVTSVCMKVEVVKLRLGSCIVVSVG
jgi:hypothetical protein